MCLAVTGDARTATHPYASEWQERQRCGGAERHLLPDASGRRRRLAPLTARLLSTRVEVLGWMVSSSPELCDRDENREQIDQRSSRPGQVSLGRRDPSVWGMHCNLPASNKLWSLDHETPLYRSRLRSPYGSDHGAVSIPMLTRYRIRPTSSIRCNRRPDAKQEERGGHTTWSTHIVSDTRIRTYHLSIFPHHSRFRNHS